MGIPFPPFPVLLVQVLDDLLLAFGQQRVEVRLAVLCLNFASEWLDFKNNPFELGMDIIIDSNIAGNYEKGIIPSVWEIENIDNRTFGLGAFLSTLERVLARSCAAIRISITSATK